MFGSFTWNSWRGQQLLFLVVVHVRKHTTTSCVQVSDLLPTPLWQVALAAIERNANAAVEPSLWQVMPRASKCFTDYHSMCSIWPYSVVSDRHLWDQATYSLTPHIIWIFTSGTVLYSFAKYLEGNWKSGSEFWICSGGTWLCAGCHREK